MGFTFYNHKNLQIKIKFYNSFINMCFIIHPCANPQKYFFIEAKDIFP